MTNLTNALQQLREERKQAQLQIEKLDGAISAIEGLVRGTTATLASKGTRQGRVVSAAARKRMARAQRARWANVRQQSKTAAKAAGTAPVRRTLSIASRRKIAAAQRARWARVRSQEGKKAA
jgi:hypothetical protein